MKISQRKLRMLIREARRHSVYNGTQVVACTTRMVFVRVDGDGEAIPLGEKVRNKYKSLATAEKVC